MDSSAHGTIPLGLGLGNALGAGTGVAIGAITGDVPFWLGLGIGLGASMGTAMGVVFSRDETAGGPDGTENFDTPQSR
jgi:hypothetical protein